MFNAIQDSYLESLKILQDFCLNPDNFNQTKEIAELLKKTFDGGFKVMIAGNGGSACDAMHFAEEFTGKFRKDRKPLPVIGLTDPAHITAVGNDFGFDEVFARSIEAYGKAGDVFIGITTSGNSPNIIKACEKAREMQIKTIGLLGRDGGKLKGQCDFEFIIPGKTSDKVQELHMTILHIIIESTERLLFPENY